MPRSARKRSESGVYHVVLRGINKQIIFYDDNDREVFLNRLKLIKEQMPYKIFAFCLMSNHIHLLLKEDEISISRILMKVLSSYVYWYNRKYERIGNLFQDRYKSEVVETDSYLLCAARYIHQNPKKAGLENELGEFKWSSYNVYFNGKTSFIDIDFILNILGGIEEYKKFMSAEEHTKCLDFESTPYISDEKLIERIELLYKKYRVLNISSLEKGGRDEILSMIRAIPGSSIRQISRITGVPVSIVRYIK